MSGWEEEVETLKSELTHTRQRLRVIAERYVLATAAARVGVWDWNLLTGHFYLDANIKSFLGYQDHEIPNDLEVWAQYIHSDDADAVMKAAQDAIDGRTSEYVFEHRMRHKNGSVRWFMVRGKVIRDRKGKPVRFVGTDTDITERRELERQVRELSNEVQTQIGHDLHDSLGQLLTALSLKLRNIEENAGDAGSPVAKPIEEARSLTEQSMELTEALARGLSPVLGPTGLTPGLRNLAEDAERLYGIECRVELPEELSERLSSDYGNELYRIAQEAVTNAVRHAGATRVEIEGRVFNERFLLNIVDNGTGLDLSESDNASMIIQVMKYRARHMGGSLTISRRRDGGTLVVCSCPLPRW
jgi:PAS domain S-box-containing protein